MADIDVYPGVAPTIAQAFHQAAPGDRVLVHAGTYNGMQQLDSNKGGTASSPITIVSIDGKGLAKVVAGSGQDAAIKGLGVHDVVVDGFELVGGGKAGIQFSQSGIDFSHVCARLTVQNCTIHDSAQDGVKISQCDGATVAGNTISACGQQCIDFLDVNGGTISQNDCTGAQVAGAIVVKGGSQAISITYNTVHDLTGYNVAGISIGGDTDFANVRPANAGWEAHGVSAAHNTVTNVRGLALSFRGALSCSAALNTLESVIFGVQGKDCSYFATGAGPDAPLPTTKAPILSKDLTIHYNTITGGKPQFGLDKSQDAQRDNINFTPYP